MVTSTETAAIEKIVYDSQFSKGREHQAQGNTQGSSRVSQTKAVGEWARALVVVSKEGREAAGKQVYDWLVWIISVNPEHRVVPSCLVLALRWLRKVDSGPKCENPTELVIDWSCVHSELSGLHLEGTLMDKLFTTSGTWLTLRGAVLPESAMPQMSEHWNTDHEAWMILVGSSHS